LKKVRKEVLRRCVIIQDESEESPSREKN